MSGPEWKDRVKKKVKAERLVKLSRVAFVHNESAHQHGAHLQEFLTAS